MKNIILIGYMGCGKSTIGRNLAKISGCKFLDMDRAIEEKAGKSIMQIFEQDGEAAFRDMETAYLQELLTAEKGKIISTGGGIPVREENRRLLKQLGTVIYLKVRPETVYERIKGDKTRPLLQCDNPLVRIQEMLKIREPLYEDCADIIIEADERKQQEISGQIKEDIL